MKYLHMKEITVQNMKRHGFTPTNRTKRNVKIVDNGKNARLANNFFYDIKAKQNVFEHYNINIHIFTLLYTK